jgi:uncharacterized protein YecE (DUF72 family)
MTKIEKLKEINAKINEALFNLETYVFINNIEINEQLSLNKKNLKKIKSKL